MSRLRIIVLVCVLAYAAPVCATQIGVFFVHGKGRAQLADKAQARAYWDGGYFLSYATMYMPYDWSAVDGTFELRHQAFGKYAWGGNPYDPPGVLRSGPGVVSQMAAFIRRWNITRLLVVTHSMGGNVVRTILSRTNYFDWCSIDPVFAPGDPLCKQLKADLDLVRSRVVRVFPIAAPFTGSEAADLATNLSGSWLFGWLAEWLSGNDASTVQCRTDRMALYNARDLYGTAGRPWPGPYKAQWLPQVSGMWGTIAAMGNDYVHTEDWQLGTCAGIVPFAGGLSDGLVSLASQSAVGSVVSSGIFQNNHFHSKSAYGDIWCDDHADLLTGGPGCRGLPYGMDQAYKIEAYQQQEMRWYCGNRYRWSCYP